MKKTLKGIILLCSLLCLMTFAVSCSGGLEPPNAEELYATVEDSLASSVYRMDLSLDFATDSEDLEYSFEAYSDMELYAVKDGKNSYTYMSIDTGRSRATIATTIHNNTYYMYVSGSGTDTTRVMCKLTDEQLALLEKPSGDGDLQQTNLDFDITLGDFNVAAVTEQDGKQLLTLSDIKDDTLDKINGFVESFISTDGMEYDDVSCVFTVSEDTLEAMKMTLDFSVEEKSGFTTEAYDVVLTMDFAFDYSTDGVEAPAKASLYSEVYFEDLYGVTTAEDYKACEDGEYVIVNTYIQDKESFRSVDGVGVASFYTQYDYGCYLHNVEMTKEEYDKLQVGSKVVIYGHKATVDGQPTVVDVEIRFVSLTNNVYSPVNITEHIGTENLEEYRDQKFAFRKLTVVAANDEGAAFLYGHDGTGKRGSDIYFKAEYNNTTYTFVLNVELLEYTSDDYEKAESLRIGDVIDVEGFLNWCGEEPLPHIYSIAIHTDLYE